MSSIFGEDSDAQEGEIRSILRSLSASSSLIETVAFVSPGGILVVSTAAEHDGLERFGAMCASLMPLARQIGNKNSRYDGLCQVMLDNAIEPMLLAKAGRAGFLAVAALPGARLDQFKPSTSKAVEALLEIFSIPA